jgi:hypothetical protein
MALIHMPLVLAVGGGAFVTVPTPDHRPHAYPSAVARNVILADATHDWLCKTFCPGAACPKDCLPEHSGEGGGEGPGHGEKDKLPEHSRGGDGEGPGHGEREMRRPDAGTEK